MGFFIEYLFTNREEFANPSVFLSAITITLIMEDKLMKGRILFQAFFAILVLAGIATASNPVTIEAPIDKVTVFLDRAQVTRTANLNLKAGMHVLTIENLPIIVDANSFSISATGVDGVTLLGLNHSVASHLEDTNEKAAALDRRIRDLDRNEKQSIADRIESFTFQKDFLESIKEESGRDIADQLQTLNLDVGQWKEAYLFIGKALRDVNDSIRLAGAELEDVDNRLRQLRDEMNLLQRDRQYRSRTAEISLTLEKAGPVDLSLTYMINGATWKPLYDARLLSATDSVQLGYYAEVSQGTGEDWNDVALTLSTAMPSVGATPGDFYPWLLYELKDENYIIRGGNVGEITYQNDAFTFADPTGDFSESEIDNFLSAMTSYARILNTTLNTTFYINRLITVKSGEKSIRAFITDITLMGDVSLIWRAKNNDNAFRLVSMTNQDDVPLMPGEISTFVDSDYYGSVIFVRPIAPRQPFKLFFGKDNCIDVKRQILSEEKEDRNDKWRLVRTVRMILTNNDNMPRKITVEEPMPISNDNRIKVNLIDVNPKPNSIDKLGKATWLVDLNPGEAKELFITLRIEYPKDANISGL